jgi:radical SAM superfamily enzyme
MNNIIDDIVITDKMLQRIRDWQADDNDLAKYDKHLLDICIHLIINLSNEKCSLSDMKTQINVLQRLSLLQEVIDDFMLHTGDDEEGGEI